MLRQGGCVRGRLGVSLFGGVCLGLRLTRSFGLSLLLGARRISPNLLLLSQSCCVRSYRP